MQKILLTSGSSFSTPFSGLGDDPTVDSNFPRWPEILADKLDYQLINCSKANASNLYIYDHLMENILEHGDSIGLVVASWSYGFKTSVFRQFDLNFINVTDQDTNDLAIVDAATAIRDQLPTDDLLLESIKQSLRLMTYLQDICDSKGIQCIHYPLLNIFKTNFTTERHIAILEKVQKLNTFQQIQQYINTIGWPCDRYLGGFTYATAYPDDFISQNDHHPSENGQKIIAQEIYDKYLQLQL